MKLEEFDYYLPEELIAQHPVDKRDESRLLVLHKNSGEIEHKHFYDIIDYLHEGDVLVRNNSKVIPARLYGTKEETGAKVEVLILKIGADSICECLCGNAKAIKVGTIITFSDKLKGKCLEVRDEGIRIIQMIYEGILIEILEEIGLMPTPPYVHEMLKDNNRYQNVYAQNLGSAACPTAGLHFTEDLINRIQNIASRKKDIKLYNKDISSFITNYVPLYEDNAFIYFDPPYYKKGKQLYMNYFSHEDHVRIESAIRQHINCDWIITYDDVKEIEEIYKDYQLYLYDLNYSVSAKCKASELMIFRNEILPPTDEMLVQAKIKINLRPYVPIR